jgi:hypothetical protein
MTPAEARELVRKRGVLPFTDTEGAGESFVFAVAGEPVRGSWWGHAKGHEIFNLSCGLAKDALFVKLIAGKETLVHRALWPAVVRVATDSGWRAPRIDALSARARELFDAVAKAPPLRLDEHAAREKITTKEARRDLQEARRELERALLVHGYEIHTDRGTHANLLEPWELWAVREKVDVRKMTLEEAVEALRAKCGTASTALDLPKTPGKRKQ